MSAIKNLNTLKEDIEKISNEKILNIYLNLTHNNADYMNKMEIINEEIKELSLKDIKEAVSFKKSRSLTRIKKTLGLAKNIFLAPFKFIYWVLTKKLKMSEDSSYFTILYIIVVPILTTLTYLYATPEFFFIFAIVLFLFTLFSIRCRP